MKPINYSRMRMDEIHPEARKIAVAWVENYKKLGGMELEQKVKLASDIMHFAEAYQEEKQTETYNKAIEDAIKIINSFGIETTQVKLQIEKLKRS